MGYQDWQASDRDAKNAVAAANTAKANAERAIAAANNATPAAAKALASAANAAIAQYNTAATYAKDATAFATDWFGLGTQFLQETGLDKNLYNPVSYAPVVPKVDEVDALTAAKDKILADTLASYGLAGIADTVAKIRLAYPKATSDDLLFILKNDPAYNAEYLARFAGNAALKKAGLPTLSDSEYLKAEDEYKKIFTAYGATSLATRDYYATLIGNRMDAVDVTNRMNQAYAVLQKNPQIKTAFNTYYKSVTDGDILSVILDKDTQLPVLMQKVNAAEIGGAALSQGLETSLARAEDLVGWNVTGTAAQAGYATIAKKLPRGKFLSEISPETGIDYTQATAEDIQFKKNAEAQRKEDVLVGTEIGRFGGSAGRLASKSRAQGLI